MSEQNDEKEQIKKVAKLRANIEKKILELEAELDEQRTLLNLIDSTLVQQSFKRAEIQKPMPTQTPQQVSPKPVTKPQPVAPQRKGTPLKTITGDVLAEFVSEKDTLHIIFPEDKKFDITTPPFTSFFVERVLTNMHEKDKEDANSGKLDPDKVLSFDIKQEGNIMKEIVIKNLRPERSREVKSSIRWTLEKMYERMKQQN
ncbi:MAG: hypothetical protein IAX21_00695 [Candidatus Bathyarchaeota archaeon]|nr:hypothetical protein [Candidatus Bathyarchaeum tardum]WGM90511.1 MAG: hypothetical protein NUK63_05150 [Candidatus Bathyarchaeum tardum]WNZ29422.1 MAG: hypothetical protein IAX21_00695 [Candidatus Bathyarchaeota archaeon]